MKKQFLLLLLFIFPGYIIAQQEDQEAALKEARHYDTCNYVGLTIDWGLNGLRKKPDNMKLSFWGSRAMHSLFYYGIRLKQSRFAICPGIGLSAETYQFKNDDTITRSTDHKTIVIEAAKNLVNNTEIKNSTLAVRYLDFLAAIRFNTSRIDPKEGFWMLLGGKLRICLQGATTITYNEDAQIKQRIQKENFNLKRCNYGIQGSIGIKRFSLFGEYMFANFFQAGRGPDKTTAKPYCFGASVDLL